jgi:hypothetical protein
MYLGRRVMGHTFGEIYPEMRDSNASYMDRKIGLACLLSEKPLGDFQAKDLVLLIKLYAKFQGVGGYMSEEDFKALERYT